MFTAAPDLLAFASELTETVTSGTSQTHGLLHIMLIAYLIVAAITAVIILGFFARGTYPGYIDELTLVLMAVGGLLWPIGLLVLLMGRGQWRKQKMPTPSVTFAKRSVSPRGFQVITRSREPARCTECQRELGKAAPVCTWRGHSVCGECRKSLSVLDE